MILVLVVADRRGPSVCSTALGDVRESSSEISPFCSSLGMLEINQVGCVGTSYKVNTRAKCNIPTVIVLLYTQNKLLGTPKFNLLL